MLQVIFMLSKILIPNLTDNYAIRLKLASCYGLESYSLVMLVSK